MSVLTAIETFFRTRMEPSSEGTHDDHSLHLATAALLFEVLRADYQEHPGERDVLEKQLQSHFDLDAEETRQLADMASQEAAESVSLHEFTHLINREFSAEERVRIMEMLWQVAFADGHLDPYEEALVRKIADLIYVPHRDFIRAKHRVQKQLK